ncbi:hypothetical protein EDD18DRAFT_1362088 [Armillaria luteobubalina]|uniref:Uncharacterized protein n=1 Tax=Armillaria luteobubalina TaxID=153913 RepID=A0AA39UBG4_9AGAR|nr:hypothetical protein EDD18DRAFT_1362088 [Armillaria luteobubalina]
MSKEQFNIIQEDPFVRRLRSGMHIDDALLIALDIERTYRRMFAVARDDPAIADPYVGLVNVLDTRNQGLFIAQNSRISDCFRIFQLHPKQRPRDGDLVMVPDIGTFKNHWNLYTENMLAGLDWKGVVAAGGAVLACLSLPHVVGSSNSDIRRYQRKYYPTSDIDLFLHGISPEEAEKKIISIYESVKEAVPHETVCIRTKNTISVHGTYPFRVVQIVLRLYASIGEILAGFDVDAPCFAFDGQVVWGSPRGIGAVMRKANTGGYVPQISQHGEPFREVYLLHPSELQGLARLLSLEHIATSDTSDGIRVDSGIINDITKSFDAMENNDYAHFHIPYGPNWDAIKITASVSNANFVMNDEVMQTELGLGDESWRLHRHPAFYGTAEQCIAGTCLDCAAPRTDWERSLREEWDQVYVRGHVRFFQEDPGRQLMTGSFCPIDDDDWSKQAYYLSREHEQSPPQHAAWHSRFSRTLDLLKNSIQFAQQAMESLEHILQSESLCKAHIVPMLTSR